MDTQRNTVLACVDGSRLSAAVLDYAAWISRRVRNPLTLLHNIDQRHVPETDLSGSLGLGEREELLRQLTEVEAQYNRLRVEQGRMLLHNALSRAKDQQAWEPSMLQLHGTLGEALAELEEEIRVLVIGVRGQDHEDQPGRLGAQLETVIRAMSRPVLVVNRPFKREPRAFLLAYDGSDAARKALAMVATSPLYQGLQCHLVHVVKDEGANPLPLEDEAQQLRSAGLAVETVRLVGPVGPLLIDYQSQHDLDLTVMGAFGQNRLKELLFGSVTVKMLCNSQVPLLLLR